MAYEIEAWTKATQNAILAIEKGVQPDVAFLDRMFAGPVSDAEEQLLRDLVAAANKRKGASRALLLASIWRGLEITAGQKHPAWQYALPDVAVDLGADAKQLAKHAVAIIHVATTENLDARFRVLNEMITQLEADTNAVGARAALLAVNKALVAAAFDRPELLRRPHSCVTAEVIDDLFVVIGRYIGSGSVFKALRCESVLGSLLARQDTAMVATALHKASLAWSANTLGDVLRGVVKVTQSGDRKAKQRRDEILKKALPEALARGFDAARSPEVHRLLAKLKLGGKTELRSLPKKLPLSIEDALALRETHGTGEPIALRKAPTAAARTAAAKRLKLPAEVIELYEHADGFRDLAPLASLGKLQSRFVDDVKTAVDDPEEPISESGEHLDIRNFLPATALIALGTDAGGDTLFIDPRRKKKKLPVFRYVHDESCIVRVEAESIGGYIATQILRDWAESQGLAMNLRALVTSSRRAG